MLMDRETIIDLYKKSLKDGDPVKQIKSLAKTNNVKATYIKKILEEAGLEVPDHIPAGPIKKNQLVIEAADPVPGEMGYKDVERKAAVINEDFEKAVQDMIDKSEKENEEAEKQKELPVPDAVKECLTLGLDNIDEEIKEHQRQIALLENKYKTIANFIWEFK